MSSAATSNRTTGKATLTGSPVCGRRDVPSPSSPLGVGSGLGSGPGSGLGSGSALASSPAGWAGVLNEVARITERPPLNSSTPMT